MYAPYYDTHTTVTTQAHEGIETLRFWLLQLPDCVTTQAHEGIETKPLSSDEIIERVTTQAHEGIETKSERKKCKNSP